MKNSCQTRHREDAVKVYRQRIIQRLHRREDAETRRSGEDARRLFDATSARKTCEEVTTAGKVSGEHARERWSTSGGRFGEGGWALPRDCQKASVPSALLRSRGTHHPVVPPMFRRTQGPGASPQPVRTGPRQVRSERGGLAGGAEARGQVEEQVRGGREQGARRRADGRRSALPRAGARHGCCPRLEGIATPPYPRCAT